MESLEESEDGHEERQVVTSCAEGLREGGYCLPCMHTGRGLCAVLAMSNITCDNWRGCMQP